MARSVSIGDVIEVATPCGYAYLQYTHEHPVHLSLVRVLPGLFPRRPDDLAPLVSGPERFAMLHLVKVGARQGLYQVVGRYEIPEDARAFPLMRSNLFPGWSIVADGEREVARVKELDDDQKQLPELAIWPFPDLVRAIASEWSWAVEAEGSPTRPATPCYDIGIPWPPEPEDAAAESDDAGTVRHYAYFDGPEPASHAKRELMRLTQNVIVRRAADGERWLLVATSHEAQADELEDAVTRLSDLLDGEYDGSDRRWRSRPP